MLRDSESTTGNHNGHERFRELCALYSSGSLSQVELEQLDRHLGLCRECEALLQEYARTVRQVLPILADEHAFELTAGFDAELSLGRRRLLANIKNYRQDRGIAVNRAGTERLSRSTVPLWSSLQYGTAFAVAILALVVGYFWGARTHSARRSNSEAKGLHAVEVLPRAKPKPEPEERIRDLTGELGTLKAKLSQAQESIKQLEQSGHNQVQTISVLSGENAGLKKDRDDFSQRFEKAQADVAQLTTEVAHLRGDRDDASSHSSELSSELELLRVRLEALNDTIAEQQRLLAADRDIRELMGARDLLLADVFDIDQNGRNKKPFGRIFYTKNKSLIFYAFDLDRQPGMQNVGAFQVWGAKAADNGKGSAFNMGIFYMDNQAMRRWVLKFDDPKVLAQIDSVFVTVEPHGGSHKPSGKQLLFASLRGEPNHP